MPLSSGVMETMQKISKNSINPGKNATHQAPIKRAFVLSFIISPKLIIFKSPAIPKKLSVASCETAWAEFMAKSDKKSPFKFGNTS